MTNCSIRKCLQVNRENRWKTERLLREREITSFTIISRKNIAQMVDEKRMPMKRWPRTMLGRELKGIWTRGLPFLRWMSLRIELKRPQTGNLKTRKPLSKSRRRRRNWMNETQINNKVNKLNRNQLHDQSKEKQKIWND